MQSSVINCGTYPPELVSNLIKLVLLGTECCHTLSYPKGEKYASQFNPLVLELNAGCTLKKSYMMPDISGA
jgi:hypothetical protein